MRRITSILKKLAGPTQAVPAGAHVTIRHARPADADTLTVLARLDSSDPPRGATLVAEAGGELWAAVSLDDNHLIADPFRPSGELAFRLLDRARELRRAERREAMRGACGPRPRRSGDLPDLCDALSPSADAPSHAAVSRCGSFQPGRG